MDAFIESLKSNKLNSDEIYEAFARHLEYEKLKKNNSSVNVFLNQMEGSILNIERRVQDIRENDKAERNLDSARYIEILMIFWFLILKDNFDHLIVLKTATFKIDYLSKYLNVERNYDSKKEEQNFLKTFYPNVFDLHSGSYTFQKAPNEVFGIKIHPYLSTIALEMFLDPKYFPKEEFSYYEEDKLERLFFQIENTFNRMSLRISDMSDKLISLQSKIESKI